MSTEYDERDTGALDEHLAASREVYGLRDDATGPDGEQQGREASAAGDAWMWYWHRWEDEHNASQKRILRHGLVIVVALYISGSPAGRTGLWEPIIWVYDYPLPDWATVVRILVIHPILAPIVVSVVIAMALDRIVFYDRHRLMRRYRREGKRETSTVRGTI